MDIKIKTKYYKMSTIFKDLKISIKLNPYNMECFKNKKQVCYDTPKVIDAECLLTSGY
jgi:hypothetical protein